MGRWGDEKLGGSGDGYLGAEDEDREVGEDGSCEDDGRNGEQRSGPQGLGSRRGRARLERRQIRDV